MTESGKNISPSQYRAYLLRIWMEDTQSESSWRIVLINPQTGDRRGFVDFEHLVDFLLGELSGEAVPSSNELGKTFS